MPHRLPSLLASLLLTACAGLHASHEETLKAWVGHTEDELVLAWGPPDRTAVLSNGDRLLQWGRESVSTLQVPSTVQHQGQIGGVGYSGYSSSAASAPIHSHCTDRFTIRAGRVSAWGYEGSDC